MSKEIDMVKNIEDVAIVLNPCSDNVAVAKKDISAGVPLEFEHGIIEIKNLIKTGQRFSLMDINEDEFVKQYGFPFGRSKGIKKGDLISTENIENVLPEVNFANYTPPTVTEFKGKYLNRTFRGYNRKNGRVGTRNYYLIVPTSMCASETALQVALSLENSGEILKKYSNIDGIAAIPHTEGCGCDSGLQIDRLMTTLKGYVCHPNVGGCLLMDLGCEQTNYEKMYAYLKDYIQDDFKPVDWITIQESGGTRSAIEKAITVIKNRLTEVNRVKREDVPIAKLIVGTECGASDSFSGITANPIIGSAVDKVIYGGGSAILSEVTEMVGTLEMLLPRFRSLETLSKFKQIVEWYTKIAEKLGLTLEPNLVPENIEGGLINNYIKSLGAVIKGGSTVIEDVLDYAEPVKKSGLSIMQGPGNDPESITGMVAAGASIICFSTGKGTTTGDAICPVIKIASTDDTYKKLPEDMDFNGGRVLSGNFGINVLGEELLDKIIAVTSGEKTWSEKWKQRQFQVWTAGKLSL
ncbi:altronate dehydratase [bacterium]|nr:hypothetical protein [bacterium]MBU3956627.1 altronate dehydratase [bacterium]